MKQSQQPFADFVTTRGRSLLRAAWLLTGDRHKAEDLTQTVLVRLWQRWDGVADGCHDAYARRMLYTTYLTWWRRRWRFETPVESVPDHAGVDDVSTAAVVRAAVREGLARLTRRQRAIVVLRFVDDLSVDDVAALLGCSPGTVKTHTARALTVLRGDAELRAAVRDEEATP